MTSTSRYFKLVALREGMSQWMFERFLEGRVHFGWGGPGMDLRVIDQISRSDRTEEQKITWRHDKFLIRRIHSGDRLVLQFDQPLRQFLIAEVVGNYGFLQPPEDDFNHFLECRALTLRYVPVDADFVPLHLRHDLSKRGQYYEIYPDNSRRALDAIVTERMWEKTSKSKRTTAIDLGATEASIVKATINSISADWKSKNFEIFVETLVRSLPGIEVKRIGDSRCGWDLTIRIIDPLTGQILHDDVPVQCKNYRGAVETSRPLEDLERSVRNSTGDLAYLFIIGDLPEQFYDSVDHLQEHLSQELDRDVQLHIVDQERIGQLYIRYVLLRPDAFASDDGSV